MQTWCAVTTLLLAPCTLHLPASLFVWHKTGFSLFLKTGLFFPYWMHLFCSRKGKTLPESTSAAILEHHCSNDQLEWTIRSFGSCFLEAQPVLCFIFPRFWLVLSCPVLSLFYLPLQTLIELLALIRVNNRQVSINPISAKSPSHRHLSHSRRKGSQALLLGLASSGTCRQEVAKGLKSWHHCLQGTFPARKGLWDLVKASLNCALQMDSRRGASHGIT